MASKQPVVTTTASAASATPLVIVPVDKRTATPLEMPPGVEIPQEKAPSSPPAPSTKRVPLAGTPVPAKPRKPAVEEPTAPPESLRAPQRSVRVPRRHKARVRRVRRVLRSIDTWTVFKVSVPFYLALYAIFMTAGVALWNVAKTTKTIDNVENFLQTYGWETFSFEGKQIFRSAWVIGLFLMVAGVGLNVLLSVLFNLIADLMGGIRLTVLEEEVRLVPRTRVRSGLAESDDAAVEPVEAEAIALGDPTSELIRVNRPLRTPPSGSTKAG